MDETALEEAAERLSYEAKFDFGLSHSFQDHVKQRRYGLPQDVDKRLLEIATTMLGRRLLDEEKPRIREIARAKLEEL